MILSSLSTLKLQGSLLGYITLEWRGSPSPNLQRDNLGQWTCLTTQVNLPLTWSFSSEIQQKCDKKDSVLAVSLNIRAHLPSGKRPRDFYFRKKLMCDHYPLPNIRAMYLNLSRVPCLGKVKQMVVTQGYKQLMLKPGDNQTGLKAAGGEALPFCLGLLTTSTQPEVLIVTEARPEPLSAAQEWGATQSGDLSPTKPINNSQGIKIESE